MPGQGITRYGYRDAISGFFDPSVKFGLKFEPLGYAADEKAEKPAPREAPRGAGSEPQESEPTRKTEAATATLDDVAAETEGAQIVSLDKFRKK